MSHILIVEDDVALQQQLKRILHDHHHQTSTAGTLREAEELLGLRRFDAVVLDRGLPDGDGLALLRSTASTHSLPCIILSAQAGVTERIKGLRAGAVEYLSKPFSREELLLRIQIILKRLGCLPEYSLQVGELHFWPGTGKICLKDEAVQLSRRETQLLHALVKHRGQTLTKSQLIQHIWQLQVDQPNDETIEVYVRRLRRRLPLACQRYISTVKGFGYRLQVPG